MQREADGDHRDREPETGQAVDGEGDRRGDDVVDLDADSRPKAQTKTNNAVYSTMAIRMGRGDVVDAVGERHEKRDHHQQQIDGDQVPVSMHVVIGEDDRVDHRKDGDQERHRVDDGQPPATARG